MAHDQKTSNWAWRPEPDSLLSSLESISIVKWDKIKAAQCTVTHQDAPTPRACCSQDDAYCENILLLPLRASERGDGNSLGRERKWNWRDAHSGGDRGFTAEIKMESILVLGALTFTCRDLLGAIPLPVTSSPSSFLSQVCLNCSAFQSPLHTIYLFLSLSHLVPVCSFPPLPLTFPLSLSLSL